ALYPHWRGGYYYASRPKSDPSAPLAILYVSRWSSAEKAAEFAKIYGESVAKRYAHAHQVAGNGSHASQAGSPSEVGAKHAWLTEEGPVVIEARDDTVLVTEGLDQPRRTAWGRKCLGPAWQREGKWAVDPAIMQHELRMIYFVL